MAMMICNYDLEPGVARQEVEMPAGAEVLTAEWFDADLPKVRVFALADISSEPERRVFHVLHDGHGYEIEPGERFIAKAGRAFVFEAK